jgi:hypothetical protein
VDGKPTPWRLGPSGQLGLPIALVSRAAGLNVTAFHEATNHLSAGALFDGRQGLHERLICGSLSDEPSISIWEIPQLLAGPIAPETSPSIASIRVAAKNAAELLVRLLDTPATT